MRTRQPSRIRPFFNQSARDSGAPSRNFGIQRPSQSGATIRPVTTYSNRIARNAHLFPAVVVNAITSSPAKSPLASIRPLPHPDLAFFRNDAARISPLFRTFRPFPFFHSPPRISPCCPAPLTLFRCSFIVPLAFVAALPGSGMMYAEQILGLKE